MSFRGGYLWEYVVGGVTYRIMDSSKAAASLSSPPQEGDKSHTNSGDDSQNLHPWRSLLNLQTSRLAREVKSWQWFLALLTLSILHQSCLALL